MEDDKLIQQEEDAAASEAARIGGRSGMEGMDEAQRSAAEHGGGEAEGFEEAEKLLEEQATHGDPAVDPLRDAPAPEADPDPAVHGEADQVDSTETELDTEGTRPDGPEEGEAEDDEGRKPPADDLQNDPAYEPDDPLKGIKGG